MARLQDDPEKYEWKRGKRGHPRKIWKHMPKSEAIEKHDRRTIKSIIADESLDPARHIDTYEWEQKGVINRSDYETEDVDNYIGKQRIEEGRYNSAKAREKFLGKKTKKLKKPKSSSEKKAKSKSKGKKKTPKKPHSTLKVGEKRYSLEKSDSTKAEADEKIKNLKEKGKLATKREMRHGHWAVYSHSK